MEKDNNISVYDTCVHSSISPAYDAAMDIADE